MSTIAERVAAGEVFLDERKPDWDTMIVTDLLDIRSDCNCVLGQMFGGYAFGKHTLGLSNPQTIAFGFTATGDEGGAGDDSVDESEFAPLTSEWKRLIEERRAAAWWDRNIATRRSSS